MIEYFDSPVTDSSFFLFCCLPGKSFEAFDLTPRFPSKSISLTNRSDVCPHTLASQAKVADAKGMLLFRSWLVQHKKLSCQDTST